MSPLGRKKRTFTKRPVERPFFTAERLKADGLLSADAVEKVGFRRASGRCLAEASEFLLA